MKRRDSLKALGFGTLSAGLLLDACKSAPDNSAAKAQATAKDDETGRQDFEIERDKRLHSETFFTPEEMKTITILADIIIPKDSVSGSASDAKVPDFIEFIVKDIPEHQVPMRGGLRWMDVQSLNRFGQVFAKCSHAQQIQLVDMIAYPKKAKPEMAQGVAFFNRMRDLTASGFFTTEMGVKDVGYAGNMPNRWAGVPADVLKQYGMENVVV